MKIYAYNLGTEQLEKTFTTASSAAGATSLNVKNTDNFSQNDRILIGEMGHERSEIVTVNAVVSSDTAIPVAATKFAHDTNTSIYKLDFDQVRFYRSTTGIDGTYTLQQTVNMDVDNADLQTYWDDSTGTTAYYYKIEYYHSISTEKSDQSDPIAGGGYTQFQIGRVIEDVATEVGDSSFEFISPEEWLGVANECSQDLQSRTKKPYEFLLTTETLSTVADQKYIDLSTTTSKIWKTDLTLYNYTNADGTDRTDPYRVLPYEQFRYQYADNTTDSSDELEFISYDQANNRMLLYPTPATSQSDVVELEFYKYFTEFATLSDAIETPTTRVYKLFLKMHYYKAKAVQDRAFLAISDRIGNEYESEVARLHRYRKDAGSPRSFTLGKGNVRQYRRY